MFAADQRGCQAEQLGEDESYQPTHLFYQLQADARLALYWYQLVLFNPCLRQ